MQDEPLTTDPDAKPRILPNRKPLSWGIKLLLGGSVLLAIVTAFVLRGNLTHFMVFASCMLVAIVAMFTAAVLVGFAGLAKGRGRSPGALPKLAGGCVAVAIACGMQLVGYSVGESLVEGDVRVAEQYCVEVLVPRLDRFHEEHGFYPPSLAPVLLDDDQLPRFLEGRLNEVYESDPDAFGFLIADSRAVFFRRRWDSEGRVWLDAD